MSSDLRGATAEGADLTFVLGTGRCGSSLVHEVIARHPDAGFVSNLDDRLASLDLLGRCNSQLYRRVPPALTRKGRWRYAPSEAYNLLDRTVSPIISRPVRDLTALDVTPWLEGRLRAFFLRRLAAQGRPRFVHKLTGWPRIGLLREVFPRARFLHVVRDGRAVANSWVQMPWWLGHRGPEQWQWGPLAPQQAEAWQRTGRSFVALAGIAWTILADAFEGAAAAVPPAQWLQVRYEDVVAEPRPTFARLLDFAGLDWSPALERSFNRYDFTPSRSQAFRRELTASQVRQLEDVLQPTLAGYGYA